MSYIKKKFNELTILKYHLFAIIPLMLYGIYKNGFNLYISGSVSLIRGFMPLIYSVGFIVIIIGLKKFLKKSLNITDFYYFACVLFLPITYNYLLVFCLFTVFYFLSLTKLNVPFNIIFILTLYICLGSDLIFLNALELGKDFNYKFFDLFIGKGESYLMTSSIMLCLISLVYLCLKPYYKSLITCSFIVFYSLFVIIFGHFLNYDYTNLFGIISAVIFLGSSFSFTPVTKLRMFLYSLVVAIITCIFNYFFGYYIGIFISILIVQLIIKMSNYDTLKIFTK